MSARRASTGTPGHIEYGAQIRSRTLTAGYYSDRAAEAEARRVAAAEKVDGRAAKEERIRQISEMLLAGASRDRVYRTIGASRALIDKVLGDLQLAGKLP